jgi:hypothetical protein
LSQGLPFKFKFKFEFEFEFEFEFDAAFGELLARDEGACSG